MKFFKSSTTKKVASVLNTVGLFAGVNAISMYLTAKRVKDEPKEIQKIFWDNYMDPESCRDELYRYERNNKM